MEVSEKRGEKVRTGQKKIGRLLAVTAVMVSTFLLLGGCAFGKTKTDGTDADNRPTVIIGCDDYTPFNYMDIDGNLVGIDVELAREAFGRMGYQTEIIFINWEEKKELLASGKIDCVWSSFSMEGREADYRWAGPYMKSRQVIAVNPDSSIQKLSDLDGKIVAVQSTTKPEEIFRDLEKSGQKPKIRKVISVQNRDLLYTFLSKGYVDAVAAHDTSINQFMADFDMKYRILKEPLQEVHIGVAFDLHDERGLDKKLDETLKQMRQDGTIKTIVSKYLQDAESYLGDENG